MDESENVMEYQVRVRIEDLECQSEQRLLTDAEWDDLANLDEVLYNLRNEGHP
jgi:hypothetical protein